MIACCDGTTALLLRQRDTRVGVCMCARVRLVATEKRHTGCQRAVRMSGGPVEIRLNILRKRLCRYIL